MSALGPGVPASVLQFPPFLPFLPSSQPPSPAFAEPLTPPTSRSSPVFEVPPEVFYPSPGGSEIPISSVPEQSSSLVLLSLALLAVSALRLGQRGSRR